MKTRILSALLIALFATACNGTLEIGLEHNPDNPAATVVLPADTALPTLPPSPMPSLTLPFATATPVPTEAPLVHSVQIYLIAMEDNGQAGQLVGCGDSVIPVVVEIPPTRGVMKAALDALLSLHVQFYGESGLYNALYQSDLQVESISIDAGKASVYLTGALTMGGECDSPRLQAQLEQTVMQFPSVTEADIFINGRPLADVLSLK